MRKQTVYAAPCVSLLGLDACQFFTLIQHRHVFFSDSLKRFIHVWPIASTTWGWNNVDVEEFNRKIYSCNNFNNLKWKIYISFTRQECILYPLIFKFVVCRKFEGIFFNFIQILNRWLKFINLTHFCVTS